MSPLGVAAFQIQGWTGVPPGPGSQAPGTPIPQLLREEGVARERETTPARPKVSKAALLGVASKDKVEVTACITYSGLSQVPGKGQGAHGKSPYSMHVLFPAPLKLGEATGPA